MHWDHSQDLSLGCELVACCGDSRLDLGCHKCHSSCQLECMNRGASATLPHGRKKQKTTLQKACNIDRYDIHR